MQTLHDQTYRKIASLMYATIGLHLSAKKKAMVASRLATRMQRLNIDSYEDYFLLISGEDDAGEFQMAVDLLTTNETYFFREPQHYDVLERELMQARPQRLSVWSAASSFGDEAYSIAMLLSDMQQQGRIGNDWSILGTDISTRVLHSAKEAVFPQERLRHVTPSRLKRYCLRGEGQFKGMVQMHEGIRERVRFGQLNLCRPVEHIGPFDIIFLRNVLIYFDNDTKRQVVNEVLRQLRVGGLLFLGLAEGRAPCDTPLKVESPGVFRKQVGRGT